MSTLKKTALCLSFAFTMAGAHAQIYMCKDASGRTITSDRPIPECADRAVRELDKNGRARREIPPPMTAEEKRRLQQEEEKRKSDEAAADELRRTDRLLRARYKNEGDIEAARMRALERIDDRIKRDKAALAAAEKQLQQAQAEADTLKKKNATVSTVLQHRIEDASHTVIATREAIQGHEADTAEVNAKHDAIVKRFRELNVAAK
jgi:hypothetical protein